MWEGLCLPEIAAGRWLRYMTFTHKNLGERITFNWDVSVLCYNGKKIDKTKTWKKWVLYHSPSKEPNSVIRDKDDASKVSY